MLHAKFQDHRTSGSGEEDFLRFLPYMGLVEPGSSNFVYTWRVVKYCILC